MLIFKSAIKAMQTPNKLVSPIMHTFAKKKGKKGGEDNSETLVKGDERLITDVEIDEKYISKSAALYDHYLKSRERPMLTLDNYCIRYSLIIERSPIFVPFQSRRFNYYKTKYQNLKKAGLYPEVPKELQVESGDYLFQEYERTNPENEVSHRNEVSKTEIYEFAENSRYWRYTDPTIQDPHSIQTYSSDTVLLIVKDHEGVWKFPTKQLMEKDNHKEVFTVMNEELFAGAPAPYVYFMQNKPVFARKIEDDSLERGAGYVEFFYKGLSISGIPKFPTKNYSDYAWVPKAHLGQYFEKEYFENNIRLAVHK